MVLNWRIPKHAGVPCERRKSHRKCYYIAIYMSNDKRKFIRFWFSDVNYWAIRRCRNEPAHISYQTNFCWDKNILINLLIMQSLFCKNRIRIDLHDSKLSKTEDIGFIFTAFSFKRIDVYHKDFTGHHFVELWYISFRQGHQLYWNFLL